MSRPTIDQTSDAWKFMRWFFVFGACVAALWIGVGSALMSLSVSVDQWGIAGKIAHVAVVLTFPVVYALPFLLLDAEHTGDIIVMLGIAAFINGLCYGFIGLLVWCVREGLRKLRALAVVRAH